MLIPTARFCYSEETNHQVKVLPALCFLLLPVLLLELGLRGVGSRAHCGCLVQQASLVLGAPSGCAHGCWDHLRPPPNRRLWLPSLLGPLPFHPQADDRVEHEDRVTQSLHMFCGYYSTRVA